MELNFDHILHILFYTIGSRSKSIGTLKINPYLGFNCRIFSAFFPKERQFYYIFLNYSSATNGLYRNNWLNKWNAGKNIFKILYSSVFWWIKTDEIIFVAENEINGKRTGILFYSNFNGTTRKLLQNKGCSKS